MGFPYSITISIHTSLKSDSFAPLLKVSRGRHIPSHAFRVVDVFASGRSIPAITSTKTPSRGHAFEPVIHYCIVGLPITAQVLFFLYALNVFLGPRGPVLLGPF